VWLPLESAPSRLPAVDGTGAPIEQDVDELQVRSLAERPLCPGMSLGTYFALEALRQRNRIAGAAAAL